MAKQLSYSVTIGFVVKGTNAKQAEQKVMAKLGKSKAFVVLGIKTLTDSMIEKPKVSDELFTFLEAEIENCAESGQDPILDEAMSSYKQMCPEDVLDYAGCFVGDDVDATAEKIGNELEGLIAKYGGNTDIGDVL